MKNSINLTPTYLIAIQEIFFVFLFLILCSTYGKAQTVPQMIVGTETTVNFSPNTSYWDFTIPSNVTNGAIKLKSWGGDGGVRGINSTVVAKGGQGAYQEIWFNIGYGQNMIPPSSTVRFIIGEKGDNYYGPDVEGAAGGGATGILYKPSNDPNWTLLMVAGGGGGAWADCCLNRESGQGGRATECAGGENFNSSSERCPIYCNGNATNFINLAGSSPFAGTSPGWSSTLYNNGSPSLTSTIAPTGSDATLYKDDELWWTYQQEGGFGFGSGGWGSLLRAGGGGGWSGATSGCRNDESNHYGGYGGGSGYNSTININGRPTPVQTAGGTTSNSSNGKVIYQIVEFCQPIYATVSTIPVGCTIGALGSATISHSTFGYPFQHQYSITNGPSGFTLPTPNVTGIFNNLPVGTYTYKVKNNNVTSFDCSITGNFTISTATGAGPTARCRDLILLPLANTTNSSATITVDDMDNGSSDECGISSLSLSKYTFTLADVPHSPIAVTLTATDGDGNTDTETCNVTVPPPCDLHIHTLSLSNGCLSNNTYDLVVDISYSNSIAPLAYEVIGLQGGSGSGTSDVLATTPDLITSLGNNRYRLVYYNLPSTIVSPAGFYTSYRINVTDMSFPSEEPLCTTSNTTSIGGSSSEPIMAAPNMSQENICNGAKPSVIIDFLGIADGYSFTATGTVGGFTASGTRTTDKALLETASLNGFGDVVYTITPFTLDPNDNKCLGKPFQVTVLVGFTQPICKQNPTVTITGAGPYTLLSSDVFDGNTPDCSGMTVTNISPATLTCQDIGTTVSVTVTTQYFNFTQSCTSQVTVVDDGPTFTCPGPQIVYSELGKCEGKVPDLVALVNDAADNCSPVTLTQSVEPGTPFGKAVNDQLSVSITAVDANGHQNNTCQVQLSLASQVYCQDISVQLDAKGNASITAGAVMKEGSANCEKFELSLDKNTFDCSNIGANTVTLTATGASENTSTCTATVTVQDKAPTALCKDATVQLDATGNGSITTADVDNGSNDACGTMDLSLDQSSFSCTDVGTHTVTLTVTDKNKNTAKCTATITVEDNVAPTVRCKKEVSVQLDATGSGSLSPSQVDDGSSDACGIGNSSLSVSSFSCAELGTKTVTLTVTDNHGNSGTCTVAINVKDNVPPTVKCQDVTVQLDATGSGSLSPSQVDNGSSDACGLGSSSLSVSSFGCADVGANTVTLMVTDIKGKKGSCTSTVMVEDNIAPTVKCQDVTVQLDANGNGSITTADVDNGSNDACGIMDLSLDQSSFSCTDVGSLTVTLTVTDNNENTAKCTATITVEDNIAPKAMCFPSVGVKMDENDQWTITPQRVDNGSFDACGIKSLSLDKTTVTCSDQSVTLTVTDNNGNISTCKTMLSIYDFTAPVPDVAALPTITAECDVTLSVPTATDNCDGTILGVTEYGLTFNRQGTYKLVWAFVDASGNWIGQQQTVIIKDLSKPVPDVPSLPTIYGNCGTLPSITPPTATDNCAGKIIGTTGDPMTYNAPGKYTIKWDFDDGNGNILTQLQAVIIKDETGPVPDVANLFTYIVECSVTIRAVPTATDNCAGKTIKGTTTDPLTYTEQGTYTINWTYDDGNGNTTTQKQTVIVKDISKPVPDVATLPTITGVCAVSVSQTPTATDNCAGTIIGTTTDPLSYSSQGTHIITWSFDDGNGNVTTQKQTVIVDDITKPIPDVPTLPTITEECFAQVIKAPTATINCDGKTIVGKTSDPLIYFTQGTHIINWTFDNGNGNTTTQKQTVIVKDVSKPVPDVANLPTITGECSASIKVFPTANDNCQGMIGGNTSDPITYTEQGTYTITWSFDDGNGNVATQTQTVIVKDVTKPVPDVATLPTINGECSASVSQTPTATDNCAGTIIGTTTDPLSYSSQGTYIITWSFDDGYGNVATQTQTVIVDDVTKPVPDVATLPTITGECSASISQTPTATDNCAGTIIGTTNDPLSYSSQGTHTITWTFDDGNGNATTQTQTVIIKDSTAPVPDLANLPTIKGHCEVGLEPPFATDNCASQVIGSTSDPLYFDKEGTYTITWIYDDGNGNTASQDQTIVIEDDVAPVPDRNQLKTIRGQCSATVSTKPTATDRCAGRIVGTTTDPLTYNTQGIHIITWTFDDGNGNTSSQTQRVVIRDTKAPVPDQANLPTLTGSCSVMITNFPTATDNCAGKITARTDSPLEFDQEGTYAILWNYDDGNGNTSIQTQWVIVGGNAAPNARCKDISVPLGSAEKISINASDIDDGSFDDCSSVTLLISPAGGTIFGTSLPPSPSMDIYCKDGKEQNLLLSVSNEKGNTAYCQAKVTLEGMDTDNDGILDSCDNCPDTYNSDQKDSNNNGTGDTCEQSANPDPNPNPGNWGWGLKKQELGEDKIITELKAYPNPFQNEVNLSFNLSQEERTTVEIFNIHGQRVHTLLSELAPKGEHRVLWDGRDQNGQAMPAGIYLIRLRAGKALINQKVVLQK